MKNRLDTGLIGRARRVLVIGVPAVGLALAMVGVVPAQQTLAQDISAAVADAVSDIATQSGGNTTTVGGISVESNTLEFGEDESTAISDASGGHHNVAEKSRSHDK
jgi:type IV secretory pathway TrbL component